MKTKKVARRKTKPLTRKTPLFYPLILFFSAWVFYGSTVFNGYNFDDQLVTNRHPLTSQGFAGVPAIFTTSYYEDAAGITFGYRPVTLLSFAVEHQVFGENPAVSHAVNVLLYALTAVMIFLLLRLLSPETGALFPFLASLVFVIHPIHTEAVNNIKSRDELLCLLFSLVAGFAFTKAFEKKIRGFWLISGFLAFGLAVLSKLSALPFLVVIPAALVLFTPITIFRVLCVWAGLSVLSIAVMADIPLRVSVLVALISLVITILLYIIRDMRKEGSKYFLPVGNREFGFSFSHVEWGILFSMISVLGLAVLLPHSRNPILLSWIVGIIGVVYFDSSRKGSIAVITLSMYMAFFSMLNQNDDLRLIAFFPLLLYTSSSPVKIRSQGSYVLFLVLISLIFLQFHLNNFFGIIPMVLPAFFVLLSNHPKRGIKVVSAVILLVIALCTMYNGHYISGSLFGIGSVFIFLGLNGKLPISRFRISTALIGVAGVVIMMVSFSGIDEIATEQVSGTELVANPERVLDYSENPIVYEASREKQVATAFTVAGRYIKLLVAPSPFRYYYGYNMIPLTGFSFFNILSFLVIISLTWLGLLSVQKSPMITFGIFITVGGILQFSNLFFPVAGIMGERLVYVASLGFSILLGFILFKGLQATSGKKKRIGQTAYWSFLGVLVFASFVYVNQRNRDWADPLTLFTTDMPKLQASAKAHNVLANEYFRLSLEPENQEKKGSYLENAILHFESCISIYPKFPYAYFDLGNAYMQSGNEAKALEAFRQSTKVDTHNSEAFLKAAGLYEAEGKTNEAISFYDAAIRLSPTSVEAYLNLSALHFSLQNFEEGLEICRQGLLRFPNHPGLLNNAGNALANMGAYTEAAKYFETILAYQPGDIQTIQKIIFLYEQAGMPESALPFRSMIE